MLIQIEKGTMRVATLGQYWRNRISGKENLDKYADKKWADLHHQKYLQFEDK